MRRSISISFIILFLSIGICGSSQTVFERYDTPVQDYLARMAQKGTIVWNDLIRPVSKQKIKEGLDSVEAHHASLSEIEKKELAFYQREFTTGVRNRIMSAKSDMFRIDADPIVTAFYAGGTGKDIKHSSIGVNFWGNAGKHIAFQFSFHDINEKGNGLDSFRNSLLAGSEPGTVLYNDPQRKGVLNFTEIRASVSYTFNKGFISLGQDHLTWGYGENGMIVRSAKAPTYPYIRLEYQPLSWLRFHYSHAWLQSGIVDSNRSYVIPGGIFSGTREVFINKYIVSHSIDVQLTRGLQFSFGESVVYNDQAKIGYLIPIMFFKAFDNYSNRGTIQAGDNGQMFFSLSSRNQLRNTHLYASLFVDEVRISAIFDQKQARNQVGYTVGGSVTDLASIKYLTAGAEYTRIRPFVYANFLPAQTYSSSDYSLGDWMGNNADRLIFYLKYTPLPKLKLMARYQYVRKGAAGTLEQQYSQQPQQPFLFGLRDKQDEFVLKASYEYLNRLCLTAYYSRRYGTDNTLFAGLTYGL